MRPAPPPLSVRIPRLIAAATAAALIAVVTLTAQQQFDPFPPAFEGELWEMVATVMPPDGGGPVNGVEFTAVGNLRQLYVTDLGNETVVLYDSSLAVVELPDADWALDQSEDPTSPVYGWEPNQLTTATVQVDGGADQTAILVSDGADNRVLAFTTAGEHLFTMRLDSSGVDSLPGFLNGLQMGPGAKFILTTDVDVNLVGSFAAAWSRNDRGVGGTLAYHQQQFPYNAGEFAATPVEELTGDEVVAGLPDEFPAEEPFGVAFDSLGNLYMTDSSTERLSVYGPGPAFTRLFTFGTPEDNGTTLEFFQSYGIEFWPDDVGTGGRLFIADAINNRVVVYRPNLAGKTLDQVFELDGLGELDGFPYGIAIDPSSGRMAIGDDFDQKVWILETPDLAAFDVQVLDDVDAPTEVVCAGDPYTVRFSLTVPAGRQPVSGVVPQLTVDGAPTTEIPVPGRADGYPTAPLGPGDVMTYSYSLTAQASFVGEIQLVAGVELGSDATHVLTREVRLQVSSCLGDKPVITATPSILPQLSGWTPVPPAQAFSVTLLATDVVGVDRIDYQVEGTNHTIPLPPVPNLAAQPSSLEFDVLLPNLGDTTVEFRAWNTNHVKSDWQTLDLHLVAVNDRQNDEGDALLPPISVGAPQPGSGVTFSADGLPGGLSIDSSTGLISGTLEYDAAGDHTVTLVESRGTEQPTSVTFTWSVNNVYFAPVVTDDSYTLAEDTPLGVPAPGVLANDTADAAAPLTAQLVSGPSTGVLVFNADGSFDYTPAPDVNGDITFTYVANDGSADSAAAIVTLHVTAVNDAPSFTAGVSQAVAEDAGAQSVGGWATAITAGPEESSQTVAFVVSNNNNTLFSGQPVVSPSGTLTYTPAPNAFGSATVTVRLGDDGGTANGGVDTSGVQEFTITVNPVNDAPAAAPNAYSTGEGSALSVPAPGVLAGDTDPEGATLTAHVVSGPSHGVLTLNPDGSFVYTPAAGFSGTDSFTYRTNDGGADSTPAIVTISVIASNSPPVCTATASPAIIWSPNHKPVYLRLKGITDPEDGPLTIRFTGILQDEPTNGPGQGYTMQDGGIEAGGARAWVRAERSGDGDGRVYLVSYSATDAAGDACTGQVTIGVPHDQRGAPAVLSSGRWNSLTGQLVLAPPAPVANDDAVTVSKSAKKVITVLSNDNANGNPLTVSIVTKPAKGSVKLNENGSITFMAPSNWTGTTSFKYAVSNGVGGSDTAIVTITIANAPRGDGGGRDDDDDCGDSDHDHGRDSDNRDRDHKRGDHDRCNHRR